MNFQTGALGGIIVIHPGTSLPHRHLLQARQTRAVHREGEHVVRF